MDQATKEVLVLGVSRYNFRQDGEEISGCKVHYVDLTDNKSSENQHGYQPTSSNVRYSQYDGFLKNSLPAVYDVYFEVKFAGKRPTVEIAGFTFKREAQVVDTSKAKGA